MAAAQAVAAQDPHVEAMRIPPEEAGQLWALVQIDEQVFKQFNEYRRTFRVRGYKPDDGLQWQFDGQIYPLQDENRNGPLLPGEKIWVPLIVAQYGVRNTAAWQYQTDEHGSPINKQDFLYGEQIPRLRIIEIRNPGDFTKQQFTEPAQILAPCSFCGQEFAPEQLSNHIVEMHTADIRAGLSAKEPQSKAKPKANAWAKAAIDDRDPADEGPTPEE